MRGGWPSDIASTTVRPTMRRRCGTAESRRAAAAKTVPSTTSPYTKLLASATASNFTALRLAACSGITIRVDARLRLTGGGLDGDEGWRRRLGGVSSGGNGVGGTEGPSVTTGRLTSPLPVARRPVTGADWGRGRNFGPGAIEFCNADDELAAADDGGAAGGADGEPVAPPA